MMGLVKQESPLNLEMQKEFLNCLKKSNDYLKQYFNYNFVTFCQIVPNSPSEVPSEESVCHITPQVSHKTPPIVPYTPYTQ